ncbi:MAG: hypothetical protein J6X55_12305, partial [Victivallales bacterium]|nr:hypothetical protein [Victivallales bacterium]
ANAAPPSLISSCSCPRVLGKNRGEGANRKKKKLIFFRNFEKRCYVYAIVPYFHLVKWMKMAGKLAWQLLVKDGTLSQKTMVQEQKNNKN